MNIQNHLLETEETDDFSLSVLPANLPLTALMEQPDTLIIRTVRASSTQNAVSLYADRTRTQLVHAFVGRETADAVQMVPFNRRVGYNWKFNQTAISVGLITPGEMLVGDRYRNYYSHIDRYPRDETLEAFGDNDNRYRIWAAFPPAQLDRLFALCLLLIEAYDLRKVQTYTELVDTSLDPEPSFPKIAFYEALKKEKKNLALDLRVLEETSREVTLRTRPQASGTGLGDPVPAGQPVAALDEKAGWSLVEVIGGGGDRRWQKGWVEAADVQIGKGTPAVTDHRLIGSGGRKYTYEEAAPGNFNSRPGSNKPRYVVMHFTTGTQIRQTINNFTNPSAGVSTHLVIGRDGRVVQCVPFNHSAYHCGFSYWEGEAGLNNCTIGIELDNAGYLSWSTQNKKWHRKGTPIPEDRVVEIRHIKDWAERHWEDFPDKQIQAAFEVVKALVKAYDIEDILGHDQVNIKFRRDPGPLFEPHMRAWRKKFFKREDAKTAAFRTVGEEGGKIPLYMDFLGKKPEVDHPINEAIRLRANEIIKLLEVQGIWALIRPTSKNAPAGWIENRFLRTVAGDRIKVSVDRPDVYDVLTGSDAGPPPTPHPNGPLGPGHEVRLQRAVGDMSLIATNIKMRLRGEEVDRLIEGWVRTEQIERV